MLSLLPLPGKTTTLLVLILVMIAVPVGSVIAGPTNYIMVTADDGHNMINYHMDTAFTPFNAWIWVLPGDDGVICAEFLLGMPDWIYTTMTTANPEHSVALGDPVTGVSICFADCQLDWVWTHKMTLLPVRTDLADNITIEPHPVPGVYQVADCTDGYPVDHVTLLANLQLHPSTTYHPPLLEEVICTGPTLLEIAFDQCVDTDEAYLGQSLTLVSGTVPADTIPVDQVTMISSGSTPRYYVHLSDAMVPGTSYELTTRHYICCTPHGCAFSDLSFIYDEPVNNKATSWGAVKSLYAE